MAERTLETLFEDDPLLAILSDARPDIDGDVLSSAGPTATKMVEQLLDHLDHLEPRRSPETRLRRLRRQPVGRHMPRGKAAAVVTTAAVVLVLAVAGLTIGSATPKPNRNQDRPGIPATAGVETVAYRTQKAISNASDHGIEYVHEVNKSAAGAVTSTVDLWAFGKSHRMEIFGANGKPVADVSSDKVDGAIRGRVVDYSNKVWRDTSESTLSFLADNDVGQQIRKELSQGQLHEAGSTVLDGHATLVLKGTTVGPFALEAFPAVIPFPAAMELLPKGSNAKKPVDVVNSVTLWVNPKTFLPVQRIIDFTNGDSQTAAVDWSEANDLSEYVLQAPVPPGFSHASPLPTTATTPG